MPLTLELTPEVEAALMAEAEARGLRVEEWLIQLAEESIASTSSPELPVEEAIADLEDWGDSFPQTPILPDEAISRESLYPDRW